MLWGATGFVLAIIRGADFLAFWSGLRNVALPGVGVLKGRSCKEDDNRSGTHFVKFSRRLGNVVFPGSAREGLLNFIVL